jgi:hypothetical protein
VSNVGVCGLASRLATEVSISREAMRLGAQGAMT